MSFIHCSKLILEYVQEIGRAGRDGECATATLYYNASDIAKNITAVSTDMRAYCTTTSCKRQFLADYFMYQLCDNDKKWCCVICKKLY